MSPSLLARLVVQRRFIATAVAESCSGRFRYRDASGVWRMNTVSPWRVSVSDYHDPLTLVRKGVLMPRIREVYVQPFDSVQGIAEGERMPIGRYLSVDLADAVKADHWCEDAGCDVYHALEADAPYSAAGLLSGATECANVDAVIFAHRFNGTLDVDPRRDVYSSPDWSAWEAFHDEHGVECGSCGSYTYGDECWTPDQCSNCLAPLS